MTVKTSNSTDKQVLVASETEMEGLLRDLLAEGKMVRVQVKGYSMLPFLWNRNEQVEMTFPHDSDLIPGTLVVFVDNGRFLVHRILKVHKEQLIIVGDGNYQLRELVKKEQVVGIVRNIIYPGGAILGTDSKKWRLLSKLWLKIKPFCKWMILFIKKIGR